jgi:hypothetical protein
MKKLLLSLTMLAATVLLKAQNPYPIIAIDTVQFVNAAKLANPTANTLPDYTDTAILKRQYGDTVRFEGIVAFNPKAYGLSVNRKALYLQRKGGGPWSGVQVMCDPAGYTNPGTGLAYTVADFLAATKFYDVAQLGYRCRFTGVIRNFQGETQINMIPNNANFENSVEPVSLVPDTLVYTEINARDLMAGNPNSGWVQQKSTAERWEGGLVTIRNVSVYSVQISGNRTFWSVIDDFGNVIDVRDFSAYYRRDGNGDSAGLNVVNTSRFNAPAVGTRLEYIRGAVTEYVVSGVSRYGITPLYPTDMKVCTVCPPTVKLINRNPVLARATDTLNITVEITTGDTTLRTQYLYYRSPATPNQLDSVLMTAVPSFPNYFVGKVNPVGTAGFFRFWIRAEDRKNRQTFFPDPLTLGRSFYITQNGVNDIATLQLSNANNLATIWDGDSLLNINVRGVITSSGSFGNLMTMQSGTGPNSAIFIQRGPNDSASSWVVGDSVQITRATVRENFNVTTLFSVIGNKISSGNALPPFARNLPIDSFAANRLTYARPYEGVMMRFDSVVVTSTNSDAPGGNFGEFSFGKTTAGSGLRVDDLNSQLNGFNRRIVIGMPMSFIQGPMYFSFGNFKLIPRGLSDLDDSAIDTIAPVITLKGNNPDTVSLSATVQYADSGATAMDNKEGDITSKIVVTGSVNRATAGTYTLLYKVSDLFGNMDSTLRIVVVRDTANSINENELNFAQLMVFPNPAQSSISVKGNFIKTQPVTITVMDILGKQLEQRVVTGTQFNEIFDLASRSNGVYFCTISNAQGSKTLKFIVNNN